MASMLIITEFDIGYDARPRRIINFFKNKINVTVLSRGHGDISGAKYETFLPEVKKPLLNRLFLLILRLISTNPLLIARSNEIESIVKYKNQRFDIVYCFDIRLLPIIVKYLNYTKLVIDLREAYPLHYNESIIWRLLVKKIYGRICKDYLENADILFTVSSGLVNYYKTNFEVDAELLFSLPIYHDIQVEAVNPEDIKLVYHGSDHSNRNIEEMIQVIGEIGKPYSLYLHLCQSDRIEELAKKFNNVFIKNFLPFNELITYSSKYDIGIFIAKPINYNLKYCMPNKLFQYIQSRLMIISSPLPDLSSFINENEVGIVTPKFHEDCFKDVLQNLDHEQIMKYKLNSDKAAKIFHEDNDNELLLNILDKQTV